MLNENKGARPKELNKNEGWEMECFGECDFSKKIKNRTFEGLNI